MRVREAVFSSKAPATRAWDSMARGRSGWARNRSGRKPSPCRSARKGWNASPRSTYGKKLTAPLPEGRSFGRPRVRDHRRARCLRLLWRPATRQAAPPRRTPPSCWGIPRVLTGGLKVRVLPGEPGIISPESSGRAFRGAPVASAVGALVLLDTAAVVPAPGSRFEHPLDVLTREVLTGLPRGRSEPGTFLQAIGDASRLVSAPCA